VIENFLQHIQSYLEVLPFDGYGIIFLLAFLEALAFVGVLFPGTIIIVFVGFLAYGGVFDLEWAFVLCVVGALIGDLISYYMGKRKGLEPKISSKSIFKWLYIPEAGTFLLSQGGLSVVLGRFLGPTRSFTPFYMGAAGEGEKKFILYDFLGVLIWAAFYLMLGYVFGNSYELIKSFIGLIMFFVALLMVLTIGPLVLAKIYKKKIL
jgi:membrane protein DedA with SNARE-associated domain